MVVMRIKPEITLDSTIDDKLVLSAVNGMKLNVPFVLATGNISVCNEAYVVNGNPVSIARGCGDDGAVYEQWSIYVNDIIYKVRRFDDSIGIFNYSHGKGNRPYTIIGLRSR